MLGLDRHLRRLGRNVTSASSCHFLLGARLTFQHLVAVDAGGSTTITVRVTLAGPLAFFWNAVLGKNIANGLSADLARLEAAARAAAVPA